MDGLDLNDLKKVIDSCEKHEVIFVSFVNSDIASIATKTKGTSVVLNKTNKLGTKAEILNLFTMSNDFELLGIVDNDFVFKKVI